MYAKPAFIEARRPAVPNAIRFRSRDSSSASFFARTKSSISFLVVSSLSNASHLKFTEQDQRSSNHREAFPVVSQTGVFVPTGSLPALRLEQKEAYEKAKLARLARVLCLR